MGDRRSQRRLGALLRERGHRLVRNVDPQTSAALRLLPLLLHASFDHDGLAGEAPGVASLRFRPTWPVLSRRFGLQPPSRAQRDRRLVDAVIVIPGAHAWTALAILAPAADPADVARVQERLDAARGVLRDALALRALALAPSALAEDRDTVHRMVAFGALVAGALAPPSWEALTPALTPLSPAERCVLAGSAPTPLAAFALTLVARSRCPSPLRAAVSLLTGGTSARQLADPDAFVVAWTSLDAASNGLEDVLRLARPGGSPAGASELGALLAAGRRMAVRCATAIRATRLDWGDRWSRQRWLEAVGTGIPRVLLPALAAHLEAEAAAGRLTLQPIWRDGAYEVQAGDACLARGTTPVQARVRAIALAAAAAVTAPGTALRRTLEALGPPWRALARRLGQPVERRTSLLVAVAGTAAVPGEPFDPLNRGAQRACDFEGALAIVLSPGRRAVGRMLSPEETVRAVLTRGPVDACMEVLAADAAARPVAARLGRIADLARDSTVRGPVAVEAGGRVLLQQGRTIRTLSLKRFASRPRLCTPDPEAPDISTSRGERRGFASRERGIVRCRATDCGPGLVALLYTDGSGRVLREEVPSADVDARLDEARAIVRGCSPPAVLLVNLPSAMVTSAAAATASAPGAPPPTPPRRRALPTSVAVRGALPFVEIDIGDERFGGRQRLGWRAAAEALLARWPAGQESLAELDAVTASFDGAPAPALVALYASGVARRRLRTHLLRAAAPYRAAATRRREG